MARARASCELASGISNLQSVNVDRIEGVVVSRAEKKGGSSSVERVVVLVCSW